MRTRLKWMLVVGSVMAGQVLPVGKRPVGTPGFSLIIVIGDGAVTAYEYEGDHCTRNVYSANSSGTLIDANHVHMLRNEGSVVARTIAVQLVPKTMEDQRRINVDTAPSGPGCP